ncbi:hypothetical protein [Staphylococcus casei]|uniref:Uncharacterized protein n=1 Tax=Staphylococcus casei TaxID=201828 RepID=A0ABZ2WAN6_9STAP|nr:hypothetical protein BU056_03750 [Staphylococcus succinus]
MGSILLIGLLIPIVYLMQLTKQQQQITMKRVGFTTLISVVGVVVAAILFSIFTDIETSFWIYMLSAIIVGIVWALILSGCYYIYQLLTNHIEK